MLLSYDLIQSAYYTSTAAALALLPLPIVLSVASPFIGALAGRIGPRLLLTVGPLMVATGFLLAFRVTAQARYLSEVLPMILLIAAGLSGAVAPLITAVLTTVDPKHIGSASGFNSAMARTGGLIATALVGSVGSPRHAPRACVPHRDGVLRGRMLCRRVVCRCMGRQPTACLIHGNRERILGISIGVRARYSR